MTKNITPQNVSQRWCLLLFLVLAAACAPKPVPTPTPPAITVSDPQTAPPTILKELYICMVSEPEDLFLYSSPHFTATAVHHALYENLYTTLDYDYQAQGLVKLPNLDDGDAVVNHVTVQAGDTVVDANGRLTTLTAGTTLLDAAGVPFEFNGEPVELPQMVVDFTLKPMVWSDGTAVTAADSVFSYEVAAYYEADSQPITHTASYTAVDNHTVRWTGLPGWLDQTYFRNVWTPLPQHQLAHHEMAELANLFGPNPETPILSSGPFVMKEWISGASILLQANPYYYRQSEGLPRLTQVEVKFIPDVNSAVANFLAGRCDILTNDVLVRDNFPFIREAEAKGLTATHFDVRTVFEHIAFGINSYGGYGDGNGRPDWFEDVRMRQAIAHCTDRQRMVDEILFGLSEVMHTYVPSVNPLYPVDIPQWPYDVAAANALLDEAGYLDTDGDGIREDPATGTPFRVSLGTTVNNEMRQQVVQIFKENQLACGIDVELSYLPASQWFADGPEGKLFGRQYDLAEYAWLTEMEPPCGNWLSQNISGPAAEGFAGWDGVNNTGWGNEEFDAACRQAQRAFRGSPEYVTSHQAAMRLFAEQLPVIPLFPRVKGAANLSHVRNFNPNPTQPSELWNIEELDITLSEGAVMRATILPAEFCAGITEGSTIECEALVMLYQQMGSHDWSSYSDWLTSSTPCSWSHVTCAGNRVVELEISSNGSGTLPPQLGNFAYLQNLQLFWLGFSTLPPEIGNLTNLRRLTLSGGNLPTLPSEIGNLTNLRHLALTGNNLTALPPEFYNLVNLVTLDLSGNKLSSFSPEITSLDSLKSLDLGSNGLSSVPPEIFTLTDLTELDLGSNNITDFPPEIGNLTNLVNIQLLWNEISDLPPELWRLTHLTKLNLARNNLSHVPPEIGNLTNLESLSLSYNTLTSLPPEIGNLTNLHSLNLRVNNLGELPREIGNLIKLGDLDVANNNLHNLPSEIGNLRNLAYLNLYQNNLSELPPEIGNLVNLYSLDLGQNNLTRLPLEIGNLRYLRWLDLPDNPLNVLPAELCAALPENISVHPSSLCTP